MCCRGEGSSQGSSIRVVFLFFLFFFFFRCCCCCCSEQMEKVRNTFIRPPTPQLGLLVVQPIASGGSSHPTDSLLITPPLPPLPGLMGPWLLLGRNIYGSLLSEINSLGGPEKKKKRKRRFGLDMFFRPLLYCAHARAAARERAALTQREGASLCIDKRST